VKAANDQVQYGMIGTGSRGSYLLKHLKNIPAGRCVALCDIQQTASTTASDHRQQSANVQGLPRTAGPQGYRRGLRHHAAVRALPAHARRALSGPPRLLRKVPGLQAGGSARPARAGDGPPQAGLQTGLQRRYSYFYQMVKDMVDKGILGNVHHIHAQWHRNMINKPSTLWTMKPGGPSNIYNWRIFRSMSGGLPAELTSHQVDIADWMFGSSPEFVMGLGSLDTLKDGRDVYDNIQLIYRYPAARSSPILPSAPTSFCPSSTARARRWAKSSWAPMAPSRSPWATTCTSRPSPGGIASRPRPRPSPRPPTRSSPSWPAPPWSLPAAPGPIPS
jgi:hypothetical protein